MKLFIVLSLAIGSALSASIGSSGTDLMMTTFGEIDLNLLHMAVFLNHSDHIVPLIQKGANVNATDTHSYTPSLHFAVVYNGSENAVRLLIENGADLNGKTYRFKWTPLHFAYFAGQQNIVNLLINNGADQEALDNEGRKPNDVVNDPSRQLDIDTMNTVKVFMKHLYEDRYDDTTKALGIA